MRSSRSESGHVGSGFLLKILCSVWCVNVCIKAVNVYCKQCRVEGDSRQCIVKRGKWNCCILKLWVDREELQKELSMFPMFYVFLVIDGSNRVVVALVRIDSHVVWQRCPCCCHFVSCLQLSGCHSACLCYCHLPDHNQYNT